MGGGALWWELIGLLAVAWTLALVGIIRMLSLMPDDDAPGHGAAGTGDSDSRGSFDQRRSPIEGARAPGGHPAAR
jgi:hypothetical protein